VAAISPSPLRGDNSAPPNPLARFEWTLRCGGGEKKREGKKEEKERGRRDRRKNTPTK